MRIPQDVLDDICDYLEMAHKASLFTFSVVSRICRRAALRLIVRSVHLQVIGRKRLEMDYGVWLDLLTRNDCLKYVRCVRVSGRMPTATLDAGATERPGWTLTNENWYGGEEIFGPRDDTTFVSDPVPTVTTEEDQAWIPLANLLTQLPALFDLYWDEPSQFPPCLLAALHSSAPSARLHISTFRFRSLNEPQVSPHEMAIATSPCLYSIAVQFVDRDSEGNDDYNEEAVMQIVAGLAPNLKEVKMVVCHAANSPALMRFSGRPRGPFRGLPLPANVPGRKGCLHKLVFVYNRENPLSKWSEVTDFSHLRIFQSEWGSERENVKWFTRVGGLPNLEHLDLFLREDNLLTVREFDNPAASRNLLTYHPTLLSLSLAGYIRASHFAEGLRYHEGRMKKLVLTHLTAFIDDISDGGAQGRNISQDSQGQRPRIMPFVRHWHIRTIHEFGSRLKSLQLPFRRTNGDAHEVQAYRILGTLPRLRHIFLIFKCSPMTVVSTKDRPSWDQWDFEPFGKSSYCNGQIKEAFFERAVDETLARRVFDAISSAKPPGSPRLESLKVHPYEGINTGDMKMDGRLQNAVRHVSRSWLIERSPRDDRPDDIAAMELGRRSREARVSKHPFTIEVGDLKGFLDRIWNVPEGEDWKDHWRSAPLGL